MPTQHGDKSTDNPTAGRFRSSIVIEYIYKGFKLSFQVSELSAAASVPPDGSILYEAHGNAVYLLSTPKKWFSQTHFHADNESHQGAEHEIKRLLENYVDFELKNFYAMQEKGTFTEN
tara:strand:- start:301 stop:654 length:354 start_codon:yes stop_codon:yes gene_type:complete